MKRKIILATVAVLFMFTFAFAQADVVVPYLMKADVPITVDGDLSEWNFAFPIDFNRESIPNSSRAWGWIPGSNDTCSGTIMMMYDDEYLYVGASITDNSPGNTPLPFGWAGDGVEIYLANWDIGDSLRTLIGGYPDDENGNFATQIEVMFDAEADSVILYAFANVDGYISSANTVGAYQVWPDEDGYNIEAKILWADIDVASANGNSLKPEGGTRVPATWSLFNCDETGTWLGGYQYSGKYGAPWQGLSAGQAMDVLATARDFAYEDADDFVFVRPYLKRVDPTVNRAGGGTINRSITVDGDLSDWNFAFPIDFNRESIPDSSRAWGWIPGSNDTCSGTIMMAYDDDYLYVGASVTDNSPGNTPLPFGWAGDGVEIYLANWDIGDSLHTVIPGFPDDAQGHFAVQIEVMFDQDADTVILYEFFQVEGDIHSANTVGAYQVWPNEDGYNIEAKILWADIDVASENGNTLKPDAGTRVPATWSIFNCDETDTWLGGYQYTTVPRAPWQGATAFQYLDVKGISFSAALDTIVPPEGIGGSSSPLPTSFTLEQNYPNPFNPSTNVQYTLNTSGVTSLKVYNVLGQHVMTLVDNVFQNANTYKMSIDMSGFTSGVYFCVLKQGNSRSVRKMMLLR